MLHDVSSCLGAEHSVTICRQRSVLCTHVCKPFQITAGVEAGKLKHVPSTGDLLSAHVAVPPSIAAEARRAASDLGTALQVGPSIPCIHACRSCAVETHGMTASAVPGGRSTCLAIAHYV